MTNQLSTNQLSEAVVHLNQDLYLVRSDLIQYADGAHAVAGVQFVNPRHVTINGRLNSRGMDRNKMDEIRESIRTQGLKHPLIVFGHPTGEQRVLLLSGERRKRSIDKLKSDKAQCYDANLKQMRPADERYDYIECRFAQNPDIKELYKEAFTINDTSEDIGEIAVVALVKEWMSQDWTEEDIKTVTGKSITWVRETFSIIGLDEKCYEYFLNEDINRTCALSLAGVKDISDRQTRCFMMKVKATERIQIMLTIAEGELDAAEEAVEVAEVSVHMAEDARDKKIADKSLLKARNRVNVKKEKVKSIRKRKVRATGKELQTVQMETTGDTNKHLTPAKYMKHWVPVLDKCDAGNGPISSDTSKVVRCVIEQGFFKDYRDLEVLLTELKD